MATITPERPNGPVAAGLLAGGIASAVMGIGTLISQVAPKSAFSISLVWSKPVGGLSGKAGLSIIAYFVTWAVLHFLLKDKETKFEQMAIIALALLVVGLIGTFPPVWHLLISE